MTEIDIPRIPNQSFVFNAAEGSYAIRLHVFRGIVYAAVALNGETIVSSARCVPNQFIIPTTCAHGGGNFKFTYTSDDYPESSTFGDGCMLMYLAAEEVASNG